MINPKYSRYHTYIKPVLGNKFVKSSLPYIFSVIAITIFGVFALRPTVSTILNLQKEIEDTQKVLVSLEKKAQDLTAAKRNLEALPPESKQKVKTAIPQQTQVTDLIRNIQEATEATISALQIQPVVIIDTTQVNTAGTNLGEIDFSLTIQGGYPQLLNTMYNLNSSQRVINIGNIMINRQGDGPTVLSLTGKGYFLKP